MKKLRLITGLISVIMPLLMMLPQAAHAVGEAYYFTDDTNQTIVIENGADARGVLTDKVVLSYQAPDANNVYFGGQLTTQCNGIDQTEDVTLTIPKTAYQKTYPTPATVSIKAPPGCETPTLDNTVKVAKSLATSGVSAAEKDANQCDQGALSWATCPLIDKLSITIANLATNFIRPLLELNTVSRETTPKLYIAWENVRNLADVGFVFVFLVIIFANITSTRIDQYTIRRMLPRLVAAAILVQFSFMVCSLVVDLGNVLGAGVQGLILGNFNYATVSQGTDEFFKNIALTAGLLAAGGVAIWAAFPILIPILLMMLLSILAFFFIMSVRFMVIAILIVISPLAFLAWTLPNTEEHYQTWWKAFFRLVMMYPIIMAILAIAGRVNELLAFTGSVGSGGGDIVAPPSSQDNLIGKGTAGFESLVIGIVRPFLIIATFALITRTYHWAGTIVAGTHGRFLQFKGGRTGSRLRGTQFYKDRAAKRDDRQRRFMDRVVASKAVTSLDSSKRKPVRGIASGLRGTAGLMAGGAPSSPQGRQRQYATSVGGYYKELDDLKDNEASLVNLQTALKASYRAPGAEGSAAYSAAQSQLLRDAPALMQYTETQAGRMAMVKRLADMDALGVGDIERIRASDVHKGEFGLALSAASKEVPGRFPLLVRTKGSGQWDLQDASGELHYTPSYADGDVNVGVWSTWVSTKGASDYKDKLNDEIFKAAAEVDKTTGLPTKVAQDVAAGFALRGSANVFGNVFNPAKTTYMGPQKRLNSVKMIINQPELFDKGNGLRIKQAVMAELESQGDILDELVEMIPEAHIRSHLESLPKDASSDVDKANAIISRFF